MTSQAERVPHPLQRAEVMQEAKAATGADMNFWERMKSWMLQGRSFCTEGAFPGLPLPQGVQAGVSTLRQVMPTPHRVPSGSSLQPQGPGFEDGGVNLRLGLGGQCGHTAHRPGA